MEHVFITTSLNPTYEIQDESQNWLDSELQENTIILFEVSKSLEILYVLLGFSLCSLFIFI